MYLEDTTASTMDDARALAQNGCPTGTVAAALFQEKGRGRVPGRTWQAPPGSSLLATLVLRRADLAFPLEQLTLRAGVAAALGIEELAGIRLQLKWPNDLLWSGRKLAGLLCEAAGEVVLVGMGVNCTQESFPPELAGSACSLRQACGRPIAAPDVLGAILRRLKESSSGGAWREALRERLYRRGQAVRVELLGSREDLDGTLVDVDDSGRLVLELQDGRLQAVSQGELRPPPEADSLKREGDVSSPTAGSSSP